MFNRNSLLGLVLLLCASEALARTPTSELHAPAKADDIAARAPRLRLTPLLGAAIPFGEASPVFALNELSPPALLLGADAAWGPILPLDFGFMVLTTLGVSEPKACPQPSTSCALAAGAHFALRARYFFRPAQALDPWLSLGGGIEIASSTGQSTRTKRRKSTYYGPLGLAQAGLDWRLRRSLWLGGLLGVGVASYLSAKDSVSVDGETVTSSSGSLEPRLHYWLFIAGNVTFDVRL